MRYEINNLRLLTNSFLLRAGLYGLQTQILMKRKKPAKKPLPKQPPLDFSAVKFEDALRALAQTPPLRTPSKLRH
jgi:hypothetical protein